MKIYTEYTKVGISHFFFPEEFSLESKILIGRLNFQISFCSPFVMNLQGEGKKNQYSTVLLSSKGSWKTLAAKWKDQKRNRFIKKTPHLSNVIWKNRPFLKQFLIFFPKAITFNGRPWRWEARRRRYKEKNAECSFPFSAVLGKELPAVNVDNLQTFKLDLLWNLNAFADQDKQHHPLLQFQAAGK